LLHVMHLIVLNIRAHQMIT